MEALVVAGLVAVADLIVVADFVVVLDQALRLQSVGVACAAVLFLGSGRRVSARLRTRGALLSYLS